MNAADRANAIIQDILANHLPRIKEGLEKGYVDENQILIVYDHAVRARILNEINGAVSYHPLTGMPELHEDNLAKINRELEKEWQAEIDTDKALDEAIAALPPSINGQERDAWIRANMKHPLWQAAFKRDQERVQRDTFTHPKEKEQDVRAMFGEKPVLKQVNEIVATQPVPRSLVDAIQQVMAIVKVADMDGAASYVCGIGADDLPKRTVEKGEALALRVETAKEFAEKWTKRYADLTFKAERVSDIGWKPHKDKLQCACGGLVKEKSAYPESLLECDQCSRVYMDEFEVFRTRQDERIAGEKFADATYFTTGTLAGGIHHVPIETQINLNGRKTTIKAKAGRFVLTYEEIVRMTVNQFRQGKGLGEFTGPDAELPMLTCTYSHRVAWEKLHGERQGSLYKGKFVDCTPGMSITCIDTSGA